MITAPPRPALRYMGSKWRVAPDVIRFLPPHHDYVEPFGGGAGVLLRKERSRGELYNDLDGEVVSYFRILRDPLLGAELARLVALTPFSREEFEQAYERTNDPLENARRLIVRSNFGFGITGLSKRRRTGFRAHSILRQVSYASDWSRQPASLRMVTQRLQGVVIENRPALAIMERTDAPSTLFYCDPPYVHATRSGKRINGELEHCYVHEMTDADHRELLTWLRQCKAMVVLSGYRSALYAAMLADWRSVEICARADQNQPRLECLWLNPAASAALQQPDLFEGE